MILVCRMLREAILSSMVKWRTTGYHVMKLTKLIELEGFTPKGSPTLMSKVKLKSQMIKSPSHTGFINVALVHIGQIMKLVAKCICTSAHTVIIKGKNIHPFKDYKTRSKNE